MNRVYERLRDRLETMASGYPATQNGVELKILQKLFAPKFHEGNSIAFKIGREG